MAIPSPVLGTHAARKGAAHVANRLWKETETGLIYLDDGVNWNIWQAHGQVVKTAPQTKQDAVLTPDDTELKFPTEAGEIWAIDGRLLVTAASILADFKFGFTLTSPGTLQLFPEGALIGTSTTSSPTTVTTVTRSLGSAVGTFPIFFYAIVTVGAIGAATGNCALRWCMDVTQTPAENLTVEANSMLRVRKLFPLIGNP